MIVHGIDVEELFDQEIDNELGNFDANKDLICYASQPEEVLKRTQRHEYYEAKCYYSGLYSALKLAYGEETADKIRESICEHFEAME